MLNKSNISRFKPSLYLYNGTLRLLAQDQGEDRDTALYFVPLSAHQKDAGMTWGHCLQGSACLLCRITWTMNFSPIPISERGSTMWHRIIMNIEESTKSLGLFFLAVIFIKMEFSNNTPLSWWCANVKKYSPIHTCTWWELQSHHAWMMFQSIPMKVFMRKPQYPPKWALAIYFSYDLNQSSEGNPWEGLLKWSSLFMKIWSKRHHSWPKFTSFPPTQASTLVAKNRTEWTIWLDCSLWQGKEEMHLFLIIC